MSEQDALAVLRHQAGLGRLPGKLVDALEPLVISAQPGARPAAGRFEQGGSGLQPDGDPDDPDDPEDPSSLVRERRLTVAAQPAALPALSL
jgi:hypothetical protein